MALHPILLGLIADARTDVGPITVSARGDAVPTLIGQAGVFHHDVKLTDNDPATVAEAMKRAADNAGLAKWLCWGGAPGQWIQSVTDFDATDEAQMFRLGSLFEGAV